MSIDNITKQHVLDAVDKIEREGIALEPSTRFDVVINGKAYPPKEIMRYANLIANGTKDWFYSGGEPTNKWLRSMGFQIENKENVIKNLAESLRRKFRNIWRCADSGYWDKMKDSNLLTFSWLDNKIDYSSIDMATFGRGKLAIRPWVDELELGDLIFVMGKNLFFDICVARSKYDFNGPFLNVDVA